MIVLDEKIVGTWFLQLNPTSDWLAAVREIEPEAKYEITYRFRYYKDDKAFDSEDQKSWFRCTVQQTRSYTVASLRCLAKELQKLAAKDVAGEPPYLYELLNEGDVQQFIRKFQNAPFAFARMVPVGEAEKTEA